MLLPSLSQLSLTLHLCPSAFTSLCFLHCCTLSTFLAAAVSENVCNVGNFEMFFFVYWCFSSFRTKIPSFFLSLYDIVWSQNFGCIFNVEFLTIYRAFLLLKSSRANHFANTFSGISACILDEHSRNDCHNLKCRCCSNPEKGKDTLKI